MPRAFCELSLAGETVRVERAELLRAAYAHEVVRVTLPKNAVPSSRLRSFTPVVMNWGHLPADFETIVGYVHHAEPNLERGEKSKNVVTLIGPSVVLRQPRPRSWAHTRVDLLVREAAHAARLRPDTIPSPRMITGATQGANLGTWEFLADRARKDGLVLFPRATTLYLRSRAEELLARAVHAPVLRAGVNLRKFRAMSGELNPTDQEAYRRESYGLSNGRMIAYAEGGVRSVLEDRLPNPALDKVRPSIRRDVGSLKDDLDAEVSEDQFIYRAELTVRGRVGLPVCAPVHVAGVGRTEDGPWSVDRMHATFAEGRWTTVLQVVRAETDGGGFWPELTGTRPLHDPPPQTSRLIGGTWVAEAA